MQVRNISKVLNSLKHCLHNFLQSCSSVLVQVSFFHFLSGGWIYLLAHVPCTTPEYQSCQCSSATSLCRVHMLWWPQGLCLKDKKVERERERERMRGKKVKSLIFDSTDKSLHWITLVFTWANFGAEPSLDAFLVDILQTACTAARLNQGIGWRVLPHLADSTQVSLFLIRILQQQSAVGSWDI